MTDRFEPPSGVSAVSPGLWTQDAYSWTWPLKEALEFTVKATGLEMQNLRSRVAQLMTQLGGSLAFGPEAVKRQQGRFSRLGLHVNFVKLDTNAAFEAMRRVVGELVSAQAIDLRRVPFILQQSAAFSYSVRTFVPTPRPAGMPRVEMKEFYRDTGGSDWRGGAKSDVVWPTLADCVVLASATLHERRHFRAEWIVEQFSGPDFGSIEDSLLGQIEQLPRVLILNGVFPLYDGVANGAVVRPRPDIAGSLGLYAIMLCPRVAAQLGWKSDPDHVFSYRDGDGRIVAQTLFWRDGGIRTDEVDATIRSCGYLLMVREDCMNELQPFLTSNQLATAWRVNQEMGDEGRKAGIGVRRRG
jgi:hypothetical protein